MDFKALARGASVAIIGGILRLVAAVAPAILAYIVVRGHALSWPREELTAVTALVALTLILFGGAIDKPGSLPEEISVAIGWWVALFAGLMILVGAAWRSRESPQHESHQECCERINDLPAGPQPRPRARAGHRGGRAGGGQDDWSR